MLSGDYITDVSRIQSRLKPDKSFDVVKRSLTLGSKQATLFFVDGFIKDGELQKAIVQLMDKDGVKDAQSALLSLPYAEAEITDSEDKIILGVLSGQAVLMCESFGKYALLIDCRTYPARNTEEPDSDRVMQGSHDGFVETLVINTALIRRRIRDERLVMEHFNLGGMSATDVVMCYMDGIADQKTVDTVRQRLKKAAPRSLTLGFQSLSETLIRHGWLNPFPKTRTTERPDTASAELVEGKILVICDTSPQVMILPTSIFDYIGQTDDYYYPPLTGTYLRFVRVAMLILSTVITPIWYLYLEYADRLPEALRFLIPDEPGALPIILQLFLVEAAIDGLKIASMNTPNMLSNSLSVVGALILGDFAISVGWLCSDVILYMAFIAIANFAQQNNELGYAIKFLRLGILLLTYLFGIFGFCLGLFIGAVLIVTNNTVTGRRYLYPLVPFSGKGMIRQIFRLKKRDFIE